MAGDRRADVARRRAQADEAIAESDLPDPGFSPRSWPPSPLSAPSSAGRPPGAARTSPRRRPSPCRSRRPSVVEVDEERRMVGRHGECPCGPRGRCRPHAPASATGARHQQVVDPHAVVLVEVAGPVVPPRVAARLRPQRAVDVDQAPVQQVAERRALRLRHVGRAVDGRLIPDVDLGRRDVEVAADHERLRRRRVLVEPAPQALVPGELARVERRTDDPAVGRVDRRRTGCRPSTRATIRASSNGLKSSSSSDTDDPGPLFRTGPSPKFVTTGPSNGSVDAIATPFQRPSP